ncbi:MAG: hypothetical protein QME75_08885 [Deltaproteobacteria bacterium]|nr:hypothetical protein [Deltaproteobacteria bacterium]
MKQVFGFSLRFFIAFVAAKLILGHLRADTPGHLVVLTLAFVANTYFFDFLEYYHQGRWRRQPSNRQSDAQANAEDAASDSTS